MSNMMGVGKSDLDMYDAVHKNREQTVSEPMSPSHPIPVTFVGRCVREKFTDRVATVATMSLNFILKMMAVRIWK